MRNKRATRKVVISVWYGSIKGAECVISTRDAILVEKRVILIHALTYFSFFSEATKNQISLRDSSPFKHLTSLQFL